MADRIREVSCYMILDDTQTDLKMVQPSMLVDVLDKDDKPTGTKTHKTVAEAYPKARYSLDKKQLVIPVEVEEGEEFETVYNALKLKFGKKIMAHKETIKALDNDKWQEKEDIKEIDDTVKEVVK